MAASICCPRSPPALTEDLVEEILLRIPPDEPAHLFRAALVCKPWRRILSDPGFLRRYRTLHRAPPLLGYFYIFHHGSPGPIPPLVSTTGAPPPLSPQPTLDSSEVYNWVHDCRHGRVLIKANDQLIVWDPITGDQKELSDPEYFRNYWAGAVLCAVDGCDHLDCHAGPFLVVYCGSLIINQQKTWATMYSSETGEWNDMISIDVDDYVDEGRPTLLIGNALYFTLDSRSSMLKYDLGRHELSVISLPSVPGVAMKLDDGGLGFVSVLDNCIYRWSWQEADANNDIGKWTQHMVMEIETLLPTSIGSPHYPNQVMGLVEGTDTIFINNYAGVFTLDLKLRKAKKIGKREVYWIIPFMSFYTPDRGHSCRWHLERLTDV